MQHVQSVVAMREMLDGDLFDLRCTAGITVPSSRFNLEDVPEVIRCVCVHFIIHSVKSELDQLKDGLKTLNLLSTLHDQALKLLPLFITPKKSVMSTEEIIALFQVKEWSPEGANDRESEEAVVFNWENYA